MSATTLLSVNCISSQNDHFDRPGYYIGFLYVHAGWVSCCSILRWCLRSSQTVHDCSWTHAIRLNGHLDNVELAFSVLNNCYLCNMLTLGILGHHDATSGMSHLNTVQLSGFTMGPSLVIFSPHQSLARHPFIWVQLSSSKLARIAVHDASWPTGRLSANSTCFESKCWNLLIMWLNSQSPFLVGFSPVSIPLCSLFICPFRSANTPICFSQP